MDTIQRNEIINSVISIMKSNTVATLCTAVENEVHANNIYFAYDDNLNLVFVSDKNTTHVRNILKNQSVSLVIYNEPPKYGEGHQGIQIQGECIEATGDNLLKSWLLYIKRFPIFKKAVSDISQISNSLITSRIYTVKVSRIKIIDIPVLGKGFYTINL